ncbi:MAG: transporter substrate-binding domain-containing protein [Butyrivibrio sp.]|nr:transporter substrate-binding domain-containing protein [Butyrivibrio sp.]
MGVTACGSEAGGAASTSQTAAGTTADTAASAEEKADTAQDTEKKDEAADSEQKAAADVQTVTAGKLTVATSPDFAPYEFYAVDESGKPSLAGFDISLAQYIADYMGLELEVVPVDFDGVLMELQTGSVDIGLAGLSPDPKRTSIMDFSDIYYEGGQSFVTIKDKVEEFKTLADTNIKGLEIGAQTGSIQVDLAQTNSPDSDIVQLTKVTDIIAELLAGKLDGAYIETAVAESYAKNYPELSIVLDVPYEGAEGSAVGVSKGNEALLKAVNEAIEAAKADGSMDEFVAKANELASGEIIEGLLDE